MESLLQITTSPGMPPNKSLSLSARGTVALALFLIPFCVPAQVAPSNVPSHQDLAELNLEQLMEVRIERVFSASKYEQKVTRAPAAVTIVSADEIAKFGYRTLADLLRGIRGLYVTSDRNYSNFGVRGFARPGDFNTRVLLLVDGHRMNDNLYGSAPIGADGMTDLDLVERVEVISGPSSSIYGNSAFFGVINVITRKGSQIDGLEVSATAGSLEARKARATYGKQFRNGVEVVLSASVSDSTGNARLYYPEFDTAQNNHGWAENSDAERAQNYYGRLTWSGFTLATGYSNREKHVPTASFGTAFDDGREVTTDTRFFADLKFDHAFTENAQLTTRAYYDKYSYRATYPYDSAAFGTRRFIVLSHDDDHGAGIGADAELKTLFWGHDKAIFGVEYRRDLSLQQANFNDNPKTYNFFDERSGYSTGLYAETEITIRHDLLLNAGLRYDSFNNFGGVLSPRFGVIYNPRANSALKFLFGRAYRAPNAYELYLESPGFMKANPKLQPEMIITTELIYEHYISNNLRLDLSGYIDDIDDLISQQFDPNDGMLTFQNSQNIIAKGVEVAIEHRSLHGLMLRASYARQITQDERTKVELDNSPRDMAKFNAILPLYRQIAYAGIEAQYLSSLKTIAGTRSAGFTLVNATLYSAALAKHFTISASVYNLFDHQYAYPGSTGHVQNVIPQDGRSLRLKLGYKF